MVEEYEDEGWKSKRRVRKKGWGDKQGCDARGAKKKKPRREDKKGWRSEESTRGARGATDVCRRRQDGWRGWPVACGDSTLGEEPGGAVVKAGADGDDQIRFLDREVCIGGAVHAKHVH